MSAIPESVLGLLTWSELEKGVCGDPDISIAVLKLSCEYYVWEMQVRERSSIHTQLHVHTHTHIHIHTNTLCIHI